MDPRTILAAWGDAADRYAPAGLEVWDAHTHTGDRDPDGFTNTIDELRAALDTAGHRGAVVCSSLDPAGYREANDRVLAECAADPARLVPFLRVDPNDPGATAEVERSLDAGHRGIKLHPRGEGFGLDHPRVDAVAGLAVERRVPLLIHAGRGMPALGDPLLDLADRHPRLVMILAHCGISDLDRLVSGSEGRPGILFDTAWWNALDIAALFRWVDVGRILYASDSPYGRPILSYVRTMRAAVQAGLGPEGLAAVLAGNLMHVLDRGEPPRLLGTAGSPPIDLRSMRVATYLSASVAVAFSGGDPRETAELALRASDGRWAREHEPAMAAVRALVEAAVPSGTHESRRGRLGLLMLAASVALTPDVAVPGS